MEVSVRVVARRGFPKLAACKTLASNIHAALTRVYDAVASRVLSVLAGEPVHYTGGMDLYNNTSHGTAPRTP